MTRTWFVTGAGRGLGRAVTDALLARGDRVVATARRPEALRDELAVHGERALVLPLDVDDRAAVQATVAQAVEAMGGLDVVVNNAGYGLSGAVEEATEEEARAQFDTNFFGALWVTQAVLPHFRARGRGHVVQISSIAGVVAPLNLGVYAASKWALEAMSEALAGEVAPFGIKVTIVEPGGLRTDWAGDSMRRATPMPAYDEVLASHRSLFDPARGSSAMAGDPARAAQALIEVVESDEPPLRLVLGGRAVQLARATYESRLAAATAWEAASRSVDSPSAPRPPSPKGPR